MSPLAIPLVKVHILTGTYLLCLLRPIFQKFNSNLYFVGLIPCGYVLIRSMNQIFIDEFPGILTYPIGVVDCATAGFAILSMAAEMFDLGE